MNILSALSIFAFMINAYLGLYIFFLDKKSIINRLFILISSIQTVWSFGAILLYSAIDKTFVWFLFKIYFLIVIPYFALMLHFCIKITNIIKIKKWLSIILYIPVLMLLYPSQTAFVLYNDVVKIRNYWVFTLTTGSIWSYIYIIYYHTYIIASLILLFIWNRKSESIKDKRQSLLIFVSLLLSLLLSIIEGILLPVFTSYKTLGLAPIYATIWMIGVWYSIVKYRFLTITTTLVSNDIIDNIDESIILVNNELHIMTINNKVENLLEYSIDDIKSNNISKIILEDDSIQEEIKKMKEGDYKSFSSRVHFIKKDNSKTLMDAKFKIVKDKFNDTLGILVIGREVRELKQFKSIYKITDRQAEIIQFIIQGKSNREIASLLGVTARTIKGHITYIYHKLRVSNKIELFNLLKNFNLIPEQPAEKTLLLLKRR